MTKTKKETPKTAAEVTTPEATQTKEEMIEVLDRLAKHVQELRDEVAGEEKPSITIFSLLCNENTGEVSSNVYGSQINLTDLLVSLARRDRDYHIIFKTASLMAPFMF